MSKKSSVFALKTEVLNNLASQETSAMAKDAPAAFLEFTNRTQTAMDDLIGRLGLIRESKVKGKKDKGKEEDNFTNDLVVDDLRTAAYDFLHSVDCSVKHIIRVHYTQQFCWTLKNGFGLFESVRELTPIPYTPEYVQEAIADTFKSSIDSPDIEVRTTVIKEGKVFSLTVCPTETSSRDLLNLQTRLNLKDVCLSYVSNRRVRICFLLEKPSKVVKIPAQSTRGGSAYTNISLDEIFESGEYGAKIRTWMRGEQIEGAAPCTQENSFVSYNDDEGGFMLAGPFGYVRAQLVVSGRHAGFIRVTYGKMSGPGDLGQSVLGVEIVTRKGAPNALARIYWNNVVMLQATIEE